MENTTEQSNPVEKTLIGNMVEETDQLRNQLRLLEIPFNWNLYQVGPHGDNVIERLEEKDEELVDNLEFKFRSFVLQVLLSYEYCNSANKLDEIGKNKNYLSALQKLKDCESVLHQHKVNNCAEPIFNVTYEPLLTIIFGSKAYVMMECGMILEAKEALKLYYSQQITEKTHKAALFGIKASMMMEYGNDKFAAALEYAVQAKQLDSTIGEWHFLVGNLMARIRRVKQFMSFPQKEEIVALEKAVELCGYPRFKLHLAQTYREEAFRLFNTYRYNVKKNPDKDEENRRLNQKSYDIYRNLITDNPDNSRILARCAFGLTKLPIGFRDVELAVDTIEKAHEISPNNPMVNHYVGIIYERYTSKTEEALKYYKIASDLFVYGATMDLIRLKFSLNQKEYDPVPDFKKICEKFLEKDRYFQTISQIASYYFFHKNDIPEAWKYIEEIISSNPNHSCLRTHKSVTLRMNDHCDLCEVVFDDVKLKLAQEKYNDIAEKEILMKIGCHLRDLCPNSHRFRYIHLKNKILDKSNELREGKSGKRRKTKPFFKKGKSKSSSKKRPDASQKQWNNKDRSKSRNKRSSQERQNNGSSSTNYTARNSGSHGQPLSFSNRDRSTSTSKNARNFNRSLSRNKDAIRNASRSNSLENTAGLKFSENIARKWQAGSEGVNTGADLEWYGPYFKPRSKSSSQINSRYSKSPATKFFERGYDRGFHGNRNSNYNRPEYSNNRYKNTNNDLRSQSSDRFCSNSNSRFENSRLSECGDFRYNQAYSKPRNQSMFSDSGSQEYSRDNQKRFHSSERYSKPQEISNFNYRHANSSENLSKSYDPRNNYNSAFRKIPSEKSTAQNFRGKNFQGSERDSNQSSYNKRDSGSQPASRDSSIESVCSMFLPKFGSQTSLQNNSTDK